MIPIRDENPTRTTPYVVYTIIILNIIVFLVDLLGTRQIAPGLYIGGLLGYAMVPAEIMEGRNLPVSIGQYYGIELPGPNTVWITLFTSMFLHGGLLHLASNMWFFWIFGNNIEDVLGHVKFIIFYLLDGLLAAGAHIMSNPDSTVPTLGASGAIAAVMGAYIILFPTSRIITLVFFVFFITTIAVPAVIVLGVWILLQFSGAIDGMTPGGGVAYWAHIGGFAAGILMILLLGGKRLIHRQPYRHNYRRYLE